MSKYAFFWESTQVARKGCGCMRCGEPIMGGELYRRIVWGHDGKLTPITEHVRCPELEHSIIKNESLAELSPVRVSLQLVTKMVAVVYLDGSTGFEPRLTLEPRVVDEDWAGSGDLDPEVPF